MDKFQRTMELFLETEEEITRARLSVMVPSTPLPLSPASNGAPAKTTVLAPGTNGLVEAAALAPTAPVTARMPVAAPMPASPIPDRAAPRPVPAPPIATPEPSLPKVVATSRASLEEYLLAVTGERTGYPVEMLSLDADLEGDLGIDSIKRTEVITMFRQAALPALEPPPAELMDGLAGAKTLRTILDQVAAAAGTAAAPAAQPTNTVAPAERLPFIETIVTHEPGRRLVAECEVGPARHPFLLDHLFFGHQLSVTDPNLKALPVMPLAMSLEIMAEAAVTLQPGRMVRAVRDVRTKRWVPYETPTRRLRVEAEVRGDAVVHAVLLEADREDPGSGVAEATFELAATAPTDLGPPVVPDAVVNPSPPHLTQEGVYGRYMYHGPAFQGIAALDAYEPNACRARVKEPDPDLLLREGQGRRLVLPVGLIDASGQVATFAIAHKETQEWWPISFPNRIARLEFLTQRDRSQTLRTVATVASVGEEVRSDCEMTTAEGQVVLRLLGRVEEFVTLPFDLFTYWHAPRQRFFSRDLSALFRGVPGADRCTVCISGTVGSKLIIKRIWSRVLSHMILARPEHEAFETLGLPPVRAATWLAGRAVVKDAIRRQAALDLCAADVAIETDPHGRPLARVPVGTAPLISLAHKEFTALAAAADPMGLAGLGVDLELLAPLSAALKADAFTEAETALIEATARRTGEPPDHWYLAVWGAKEAAGKALGRGVVGSPRNVEAIDIDPASGRITVALRGLMAEAFPDFADRPDRPIRIDTYRRLHGAYTLSLCLLPKSSR
jgi:phosphopantetheinyl transferase